jgi:LysM repeat protein
MSNISPHSTVKTKEAVVETAQDFVDRNLNCLDACFRKLMEVLKKETEFAKGIVAMEPLDRHYMLNTPVRRAPSSGLASPVSPLASAPDQHLPPGCTTYMVRPTDSLTGIALSFKMTVGELRNLNNIHHSAQLLPGQIIIVKQSVEEALRSPRSPRYRKPSIGATGYHSPLHHAPSEPLKPGMEAPNPATRTAALRNQVLKKKISFSRDDLHMAPSIRDTSPRDKTPSPNHSPSSSPSVNNLNKFMGQHTITRRTKQATLQGSHKDLHAVHLRCQYVDMLPAQPAFINGLLTMTDTQIIFEPDLDDAMVLIKGLRHYTIFVQMSSIVHAEPLQTTDLSLQRSMDSTYLQVLTSEKQPVSTSNMLLFMSTEQKVQEWSKLMMEWLSQQKEKTLMESLNLDSFMLKMPSRSNFTLGSPNRHGSMGQSGDLISSSRSASRFSDVSFGGGTSSRVPAPIPPFERSGSSSFGAPSIAPKPSEAVPVQPLPVQPEKIIKPSTSYDDDDLPRLLDVSRIITDKHVHAFYKNLPNRYRHCDWRLLFCTAVHGTSLITFFSKLKSEAPTLIIIKDSDGYVRTPLFFGESTPCLMIPLGIWRFRV